MKITQLESSDGITHLLLSGSLDIKGVREIEMDFSRMTSDEKTVLLDFSGVTFIASLGMRMLLSTAKKLDSGGHKLILHSVPPLIETALSTAGLATVMPIVKDQPDALSFLQSQG